MRPRLLVSEFPNDNPELHDGLVWACPVPCARPLPTLRLRPGPAARVLGPHWEDAGAGLESASSADAPFAGHADETPSRPDPQPDTAQDRAPSGFRAFIRALESVLLERGATRCAASLPGLFGEVRLGPEAFDPDTRTALARRGILDAKTQRATLEWSFLASAWRDVLDGTSTDLAACGNTMLDAWGAELLATMLGDARGVDALRRALRQRGVAAFGMLEAA